MKLEIFGHTRMHFNHLSRASIVVRFHLPAGAAGRVACTPLASPLSPSFSLPISFSHCGCFVICFKWILFVCRRWGTWQMWWAHKEEDASFIQLSALLCYSLSLSLSLSPSALSLSLSLHLAFFRCTWAHVVCCSKLSIRHGVRHCRSCLAISQLPPCLTISTSTSACLPPSLTASSLSLSPHRSSRINYCN